MASFRSFLKRHASFGSLGRELILMFFGKGEADFAVFLRKSRKCHLEVLLRKSRECHFTALLGTKYINPKAKGGLARPKVICIYDTTHTECMGACRQNIEIQFRSGKAVKTTFSFAMKRQS